MPAELVTVATFGTPTEAYLARGALEAAGIRAVVSDDAVISMDWALGNAVGWVKVQVADADAERAVGVLEEALGPDADEPLEEEELARQALAEEPETPADAAAPVETDQPVVGDREEAARRLFFVAWFGLILPPVAFYALYLLLVAGLGSGTLSARGRWNLLAGGVLTAAALAMCWAVMGTFLIRP